MVLNMLDTWGLQNTSLNDKEITDGDTCRKGIQMGQGVMRMTQRRGKEGKAQGLGEDEGQARAPFWCP